MNLHRTVGSALALAAALALTPVTAVPVAAAPADCVAYLKGNGYTIGPKAQEACRAGAEGGGTNTCRHGLELLDVERSHAIEACNRA